MARKKSLKQRTQKTRLYLNYQDEGYHDGSGNQYSKTQGIEMLMTKKATLGHWNGKRSAAESYEGGQYTGGRKEGRKNLTYTEDGRILNQHGVEFSEADKRALENAVNKANRKRTKMLKEEAQLPRLQGGKPTGETVAQLQAMGKESDFIISRRSKSLQRFTSREQFENYMENLQMVNSPTYLDDRTRLYKRNHMQALENVFGGDAKDVMMKIRTMKPEKYRELLQSDEDLEISYIYDPSERSAKLNKIRHALGMKLKEDDFWDEEYLGE